MSLLSLLIALAAERTLSSSWWRFQHYYQYYHRFVANNDNLQNFKCSVLGSATFILVPVFIVSMLLDAVDHGLLNLVLSTVILIICFGCVGTRESYKQYLTSAFKGEETTTALHHEQLLEDKNLPAMGFGQALVWLNYRYYIAIMLWFVAFGAPGVVFYRLLTTVIEQQNSICHKKQTTQQDAEQPSAATCQNEHEDPDMASAGDAELRDTEKTQQVLAGKESSQQHQTEQAADVEHTQKAEHEGNTPPNLAVGCRNHHDILFWLDWLPVRVTSFGYMFVGHFSKAMPAWLESLFDFNKPTHQVLIDVAQQSEDIMVNNEDCTAEPCLLVRLAKRNVLLILAVISVLTLIGLVN